MTYNDLQWPIISYNGLQLPTTMTYNDLQRATMTYSDVHYEQKLAYGLQ